MNIYVYVHLLYQEITDVHLGDRMNIMCPHAHSNVLISDSLNYCVSKIP